MRKSLETKESMEDSQLYSFSSLSIESETSQSDISNCSIENLIETANEYIYKDLTRKEDLDLSLEVIETAHRDQSQFIERISEGLQITKDNFRSEFIEKLMTESGSKFMQRQVLLYNKSYFVCLYSLVSNYALYSFID